MSTAAVPASTILVVDDNELNRDLLSRRLKRDGHTVIVAEHGRAALDRLAEQPFDLVLLDIMMPELTGYEVLEIMKGDAALAHIPVVMITAATEEESIVRCLGLGADDSGSASSCLRYGSCSSAARAPQAMTCANL